eukprot:4373691-Pyramimonas_sp.AAC.1
MSNTSHDTSLARKRWRAARPMILCPAAPGAFAELTILRVQLWPGFAQQRVPSGRKHLLLTVGKT